MEGHKNSVGTDTVSIRPGVSVLSVLRYLNYQPWYALAEFVDNSVQSFQSRRDELIRAHGSAFKLRVEIELDGNQRIVIRDNAAGISIEDFPRAFRPAAVPPDRRGLAEFGMGMKSAACWFAPVWSVRTSALGETVERRIDFNIANIVRDEIEELKIETKSASTNTHFTEVILETPYKAPAGRTISKIKDHLRDIYRVFTKDGILELKVDGEILIYEEPEILETPFYRDETGKSIFWRKEIAFDFGGGLSVKGFAAIRRVASTSKAGFALFRRNRLIEGSGDDGYRPELIFGKSNSFIYQRLFGELHLEGFDVSHTKDGFRWDENEEPFLAILKDYLSKPDFPLLQQAREYRVNATKQALKEAAEQAVNRTSESIEHHLPTILPEVISDKADAPIPVGLPAVQLASRRVIDIEFEDRKWRVVLELTDDPAIGDWLEISQAVLKDAESGGRELVGIRLSLVHPFMTKFIGADEEKLEIVLRITTAISLSEKLARESGVSLAGAVRIRLNKILRDAMSMT